jgi:tRNA (adenine57-N1/adenine58-N1)-methyltransferase
MISAPHRGVVLLGDTVVVARQSAPESKEELFATVVGTTSFIAGGVVKHSDMLGRPYGTCTQSTAGPSYALRLTPELWTLSLPHRTQILFTADISLVVARLGLRPGSVVVESGTGSGSLTHALARAVAPTGSVHTFEFNANRVEQARAEFMAHGLASLVRVSHRDVVAQGFIAAGSGSGSGSGGAGNAAGVGGKEANALFLDIPNPWGAIAHAREALAVNGTLCSFSPCIEQVQRASLAMVEEGFVDIRTFETLLRPWQWGKSGGGGEGEGERERERERGGGGGVVKGKIN